MIKYNFLSRDIGPGNCLIDNWVRNNSSVKFDLNGRLASSGKKNEIILTLQNPRIGSYNLSCGPEGLFIIDSKYSKSFFDKAIQPSVGA